VGAETVSLGNVTQFHPARLRDLRNALRDELYRDTPMGLVLIPPPPPRPRCTEVEAIAQGAPTEAEEYAWLAAGDLRTLWEFVVDERRGL